MSSVKEIFEKYGLQIEIKDKTECAKLIKEIRDGENSTQYYLFKNDKRNIVRLIISDGSKLLKEIGVKQEYLLLNEVVEKTLEFNFIGKTSCFARAEIGRIEEVRLIEVIVKIIRENAEIYGWNEPETKLKFMFNEKERKMAVAAKAKEFYSMHTNLLNRIKTGSHYETLGEQMNKLDIYELVELINEKMSDQRVI